MIAAGIVKCLPRQGRDRGWMQDEPQSQTAAIIQVGACLGPEVSHLIANQLRKEPAADFGQKLLSLRLKWIAQPGQEFLPDRIECILTECGGAAQTPI